MVMISEELNVEYFWIYLWNIIIIIKKYLYD